MLSLLKKSNPSINCKRNTGRQIQKHLGLESLEDRSLLSVSSLAEPWVFVRHEGNQQILVVEGTNNADKVEILDSGKNTVVKVNGVQKYSGLRSPLDYVDFYGYDGQDTFDASKSSLGAVARGGAMTDLLIGSKVADILAGEDGDDVILGMGGDDFLSGDDGRDALFGGIDKDTLYGGSNDDWLYGQDNNDELHGGTGNDYLYGGKGHDTLGGLAGTIDDEEGNDFLYGQEGNDTLMGGSGTANGLWGGADRDTLYGVTGRDALDGGTQADTYRITIDLEQALRGRTAQVFIKGSFGNVAAGTDRVVVTLDSDAMNQALASPVISQVKKAVAALKPIVDLLKSQVPVLSRFDSSMTFAKLLDSAIGKGNYSTFLKAYNTISGLSSVSSGLVRNINLGVFTIRGTTRGPVVSTADSVNPLNQINNSALLANARKAGVTFGLLEKRTSAIDLLLGKPVDLVAFRLPELQANFSYSLSKTIPTGILAVSARLKATASLSVSAGLTVGLDTNGFAAGRILDGFYVSKAAATFKPSVSVSASGVVGVPEVWDAVEAGIEGRVTGTVTFSLNNGGKVRLTGNITLNRSAELGYDIRGFIKYTTVEGPWYWPEVKGHKEYYEIDNGTL